jgi:Endonuclease-reverse transcriptase
MCPLCEGNDQIPYDNHAILFCGDVNAHSKLWDAHSPEDNIGKHITSFLLNYGFVIDNDGNATYHGHHCRTAPDITTHHGDILIDNWMRQEPIGKNHHNVLSYDIMIPFAILPSTPLPHTISST